MGGVPADGSHMRAVFIDPARPGGDMTAFVLASEVRGERAVYVVVDDIWVETSPTTGEPLFGVIRMPPHHGMAALRAQHDWMYAAARPETPRRPEAPRPETAKPWAERNQAPRSAKKGKGGGGSVKAYHRQACARFTEGRTRFACASGFKL